MVDDEGLHQAAHSAYGRPALTQHVWRLPACRSFRRQVFDAVSGRRGDATRGGRRRSSCSSACPRSSSTRPGRRSRTRTTRSDRTCRRSTRRRSSATRRTAGSGPKPDWWPGFLPFSPALLILPFPGLFRFTCYYYRGAYYKAFWADPPACAVGEPRKAYRGEHSFPLILQNVHRFFMWVAFVFILLLAYDVWEALWFTDPATGEARFGIGVGHHRPRRQRRAARLLHVGLSRPAPRRRRADSTRCRSSLSATTRTPASAG